MRSKTVIRSANSPVLGLLIFSALLTLALVVCASTLQAQSAQSSASDKSQPSAAPANHPVAASVDELAENGAGMVWVNTSAGVYHKKGSRWYGKTKKGKYMLEEDAIKAGYKPAK
ncbi:MAG: hypothetical protein WA765_10285 [Candidatus Acidiferrum sp.]